MMGDTQIPAWGQMRLALTVSRWWLATGQEDMVGARSAEAGDLQWLTAMKANLWTLVEGVSRLPGSGMWMQELLACSPTASPCSHPDC